MVIALSDWQFLVDIEETDRYTHNCSLDHCNCPYCQNFYENIDRAEPALRPVLSKFGIYLDGPCEVMPFEPTLVAACYRVTGQILSRGVSTLHINGIPLRPEEANDASFFLWIGPVELPWTQKEDVNDVISPSNQPEFMDRMMVRWLQWAGEEALSS